MALGSDNRTVLGCGSAVAVVLLLVALSVAALDGTVAAIIAGGLLCAFLGLASVLLYALPWAYTEQGVGVDTTGVSFVQHPKWWIRRRTLRLPWHEIVWISDGYGADDPSLVPGTVSLYLHRTPPKEQAPTWLGHVAEGADDPALPAFSPLPRVHVTLDQDEIKRLMAAFRGHRPHLVGQGSPTHIPGPGGLAVGPGAHAAPGDPGAAGQAPRNAPEPATVDYGGHQTFDWVLRLMLAVTYFALATGLGIYLGLDAAASDDGPVLPLVFLPLLIMAAGAFLIVQVTSAPRALAPQGVHVDAYGISIYRNPKWWFNGERAHVGWQDVHHFDSRMVGSRRHAVLEIRIHLHRTTHGMRLPSWARLVMAGETKWHFTAPHHPVLLLRLRGGRKAEDLLKVLRMARPDLSVEKIEKQHAREQDARAHHHAQRARQQQGHPPHGHAPRGHWQQGFPGTQNRPWADPAHAPTLWMNLRHETVPAWMMGAVPLALLWCVWAYHLLAFTLLGSDEALGTVIALGLFCVILTIWSIRIMPNRLAHQGISVDGYGITLSQDPFLWSGGSTAHLPWEHILMVREDTPRVSGSSAGRYRLSVFMHHPDLLSSVPRWCELEPRETGDPPATAHHPLTRVRFRIKEPPQKRVAEAVRAVRPDLAPPA